MRRREFITLLGGAAAWPLAARGENSTKRLIGNLAAASVTSAAPRNAFLEGLRELGYIEGRDYELAHRSADGAMDRLPLLAEQLVRLKPDVILANPTPAIVAVRTLTKTIPIVSFMIANEMQLGLVASHARPGNNVTGLLLRVDGMVGKQVELAVLTVGGASKIGIVFNPSAADAATQRREAEAASTALGATCIFAEIRTPDALDLAFQRFERESVEIVVVLYDGLFFQERRRIAALAAEGRLPAIYAARDHVVGGGLMSYGISLRSSARRMAIYIDKIFKGVQPADLPLEFPTKLELVVNLKTAKALGLEVPPTLLARADEVIE